MTIRRSIAGIGLLAAVWACDREIPTEAASPLRRSTTRSASVVGDPESYGVQWGGLIPHPGYSDSGFTRAVFDYCDNVNHFYHPHHTYADLRPHIGYAKQAGAKWVRVDFDSVAVWEGSGLAPLYDCSLRHKVNYTLRMAKDSGMSVVGILKWSEHPLPDSASWANYVQTVVNRYGSQNQDGAKVQHWQIYNEINNHSVFPPGSYSPWSAGYRYGELLRQAKPIIAADGGKLITGGIVWAWPQGGVHDPQMFMWGAFASASWMTIDALAIHSYQGTSAGVLADVNNALNFLANSAPGKPLWLTEFGMPFPVTQDSMVPDATILNTVLRDMQAKQAQGIPWAKAFWFHNYAWHFFEPPYWKYTALVKPTSQTYRHDHPGNTQPLFSYSGNQTTILWTAYRNAALYGCGVSGCPAFSASISGPTSVGPQVGCTWYAAVSGGQTPYSYEWTVGWDVVGYDSAVNYTNSGEAFTLQLHVSDATGQVRTAQMNVNVEGIGFCS